jgi:hypothetical protein
MGLAAGNTSCPAPTTRCSFAMLSHDGSWPTDMLDSGYVSTWRVSSGTYHFTAATIHDAHMATWHPGTDKRDLQVSIAVYPEGPDSPLIPRSTKANPCIENSKHISTRPCTNM